MEFLSIHPYLRYANTTKNKLKLELQYKLLKKYENKEISKIELKNQYQKIINIENECSDDINYIVLEHKQYIQNLTEQFENNIIEYIENIIENN